MTEPVESVLRSVRVLGCFSHADRSLGSADVVAMTGLTRGTVHRQLHTLVATGHLVEVDGRFRATPKSSWMGQQYLLRDPLAQAAEPALADLRSAIGLSSVVAVPDGEWVVCIASSESSGPRSVVTRVGSRLPADSTSLGRVLALAAEAGPAAVELFVCVDGEFDPQLRTLGVPICDERGTAIAALAVICSDPAMSVEDLKTSSLDAVRTCAGRIGQLVRE